MPAEEWEELDVVWSGILPYQISIITPISIQFFQPLHTLSRWSFNWKSTPGTRALERQDTVDPSSNTSTWWTLTQLSQLQEKISCLRLRSSVAYIFFSSDQQLDKIPNLSTKLPWQLFSRASTKPSTEVRVLNCGGWLRINMNNKIIERLHGEDFNVGVFKRGFLMTPGLIRKLKRLFTYTLIWCSQ